MNGKIYKLWSIFCIVTEHNLFGERGILMSRRAILEYCNQKKSEGGRRKFENLNPDFDEVFETWREGTSKLDSNTYFLGVVPAFGKYILIPTYFGDYSFPMTKVVRGERIIDTLENVLENEVEVDLNKNPLKCLKKIVNNKSFVRENITDTILVAELENCPENFNHRYTKVALDENWKKLYGL